MELYVKISFWIGVVCFFVRLAQLGTRTWPHKKETSLGTHVAETLLGLAFIVWAAIILFVGR